MVLHGITVMNKFSEIFASVGAVVTEGSLPAASTSVDRWPSSRCQRGKKAASLGQCLLAKPRGHYEDIFPEECQLETKEQTERTAHGLCPRHSGLSEVGAHNPCSHSPAGSDLASHVFAV